MEEAAAAAGRGGRGGWRTARALTFSPPEQRMVLEISVRMKAPARPAAMAWPLGMASNMRTKAEATGAMILVTARAGRSGGGGPGRQKLEPEKEALRASSMATATPLTTREGMKG